MSNQISSREERSGAVICGAYGMGNAGDDAVLAAILTSLRRIERDIPVTVIARDPAAVTEKYAVRAVHPLDILRWRGAMQRAKLFISGGGSLLQDVTSRRSLQFYLLTIRTAKECGCAVQLYGCGVGPLLRDGSRRRTAEVLNACADVITLRDGESEKLLRDIGVTVPPVTVTADPALGLPPVRGERERAAGFVLRDWEGFGEAVPALAACAGYVRDTYRLEPVLLCLAPEDHAAARTVSGLLEREGVSAAVSLDSRRLSRMSLVISMRLHGLVFALRDGIPAAGVSYDPKVSAFCAEAGLPCLELSEASPESLRSLADAAVHLDGEALAAAASELRRRETGNAIAAAQLLGA